jgi:serine/threonine protein kinase
MAEVFLAVSQGIGNVSKYVAIKRMLHRYHNNPDLCQMFKDEAHVVIQLRHPNIAALYDFNEDDDLLYYGDGVRGRKTRFAISSGTFSKTG